MYSPALLDTAQPSVATSLILQTVWGLTRISAPVPSYHCLPYTSQAMPLLSFTSCPI